MGLKQHLFCLFCFLYFIIHRTQTRTAQSVTCMYDCLNTCVCTHSHMLPHLGLICSETARHFDSEKNRVSFGSLERGLNLRPRALRLGQRATPVLDSRRECQTCQSQTQVVKSPVHRHPLIVHRTFLCSQSETQLSHRYRFAGANNA